MTPLRQQLLSVFDAYTAAVGLAPSTVSSQVFNGGHVIARLVAGGDLGTGRFEESLQWFADHWPAGTPWPEGIARPPPGSEAGMNSVSPVGSVGAGGM